MFHYPKIKAAALRNALFSNFRPRWKTLPVPIRQNLTRTPCKWGGLPASAVRPDPIQNAPQCGRAGCLPSSLSGSRRRPAAPGSARLHLVPSRSVRLSSGSAGSVRLPDQWGLQDRAGLIPPSADGIAARPSSLSGSPGFARLHLADSVGPSPNEDGPEGSGMDRRAALVFQDRRALVLSRLFPPL